MVRKRQKKALYEVIDQTLSKTNYGKTLRRLHPTAAGKGELDSIESDSQNSQRPVKWSTKPKIVQFNAGRFEFSMPYQLAIAVILGIILLVLVAFRLGQNLSGSVETPRKSQLTLPKRTYVDSKKTAAAAKNAPSNVTKAQPATRGDNRIVIQTYRRRVDLEPVKNYFAQFGVKTEIRKIGDWYYLVTKDRYENPGKPGTAGYAAKQKIINLGARYKAPPGYETFGTKPFHDAFGQKFND